MTNSYFDETEQLEMLKRWWKEYGLVSILAIVLSLSLGYGWRHYRQYQVKKSMHASMAYQHLLDTYVVHDAKAFIKRGKKMIKKYDGTPYATMSALMLAKYYVGVNKLNDALHYTNWGMAHGRPAAFKQVARIRSARILLQQGKPKKALAILNKVTDKAYLARINEVKGDVYMALHQKDNARKAYQDALDQMPETFAGRGFLTMKRNALAEK